MYFISNFSAIGELLTLILKIDVNSKFFKLAEKGTVKPNQQDSNSFMNKKAKKFLQNLRKTFF